MVWNEFKAYNLLFNICLFQHNCVFSFLVFDNYWVIPANLKTFLYKTANLVMISTPLKIIVRSHLKQAAAPRAN